MPKTLHLEVDDLLPIVEAGTLLGFAKAREGDVEITPEGKVLAEADIETQKQLVSRRRAWPTWNFCSRCAKSLENKSDGSMPLQFFHDLLDEHFSEDDTQKQIETALNWGRYGEIFSYDPETRSAAISPRDGSDRSPIAPIPQLTRTHHDQRRLAKILQPSYLPGAGFLPMLRRCFANCR